jgi:hypothetical protein
VEPSKREELLRAIRRFEVFPLPSEVEALLRESRAIRENLPPWNVQVEVHELETLPPDWWWPLVFLAPGGDPHVASAFLLPGPDAGYLFHVPRDGSAPGEPVVAWLDRLINEEDAADLVAGAGVDPLDTAETRLALRFFLRQRDLLDRIDATEFTDGQLVAETLHRRAASPVGGA